jgi:putative ABC transport system permease protein
MLMLAFRNIFRHRARTSLTLSIIAFGVSGLILTGGFVEDVFIQLREATIHSQLGHLQVYRAGYTDQGRRDPYRYMIDDPEKLIEGIISQPQISDVLKRVNFSGLANNGNADLNIIGEGVEPDKETRLGTVMTIVSGRQLTTEDIYGALVGEGVAKDLKLNPGDFITLLANTADGALNTYEFNVTGIFRTFARDYDNRAIRISLPAAQDLVGTAAVHRVVVLLDQTGATDVVAKRLKQIYADSDYEIKTWYELADFYTKAVDLYGRQFAVLQFVILLIVLLSVVNSVNMAVYERIGEFGTLKALGNRQGGIFRLILQENFTLGIIGASAGGLLGLVLARLITMMGVEMPPLPNSSLGYVLHIHVVPGVVGMAMLIGVVATLVAALLPAYRVAKVPVAEALRKNI